MLSRHRSFVSIASLTVGSAVALFSSRSEASYFDLGAEGGVLSRSLSDVSYNASFAWQLNGELSFFPYLMVGPYATFTSATAEVSGGDTPSKVDFRTLGIRFKLKIP